MNKRYTTRTELPSCQINGAKFDLVSTRCGYLFEALCDALHAEAREEANNADNTNDDAVSLFLQLAKGRNIIPENYVLSIRMELRPKVIVLEEETK